MGLGTHVDDIEQDKSNNSEIGPHERLGSRRVISPIGMVKRLISHCVTRIIDQRDG